MKIIIWLISIVFPTVLFSFSLFSNNLPRDAQLILIIGYFIYGSSCWLEGV